MRPLSVLKRLSLKTQLALFLFIFLVFLSFQDSTASYFLKGIIALISSVFLDSLILFVKKKRFELTESSVITGLIIALVLNSAMDWWAFSLAAAIAILSKHIIRVNGRHVFNPAAFGIFSVIILLKGFTEWKGAYTWAIIIPFGLYFTYRIKKLEIALSYFVTYGLISGIQATFNHVSPFNDMIYSNFFFILVMLIEPKTTPSKRAQKILFGTTAGIISASLYAIGIPFDAEIPSLLSVNLLFRLMSIFMKGGKNEKKHKQA